MGIWLGFGVVVVLVQLIPATLLYFAFRKRLSEAVIVLILFVLAFGSGFWAADRIVTNHTLRDLVDAEEQRTGTIMSQGERILFTTAMLHASELKSAVYKRAALMALPGALLIALSGFLALCRRPPAA
jgi:hypothetical protein